MVDIPSKVKSKELSYCIIKNKTIYAIYKNQYALCYFLSNEENNKLLEDEGVWIQTKAKLSKSTEDTTLWEVVDLPFFCQLNKEEAIDYSKSFPAKWCYKRAGGLFKVSNNFEAFRFDNCPYIIFRPTQKTSNPLELFITKPLEPNILVLSAASKKAPTMLQQFLSYDSCYTIDTETYDPDAPNGWQALIGWKCHIRLLQIYSPKLNRTLIIDFGCRGSYASELTRMHYGNILMRGLHGKECEYQNALFDLMVLEHQLGFVPYHTKIRDTMSMSKNLWAGIGLISHSLDAIADRLKLGPVDKSLQKSDFGLELVPAQYSYGAKDVVLTHQCRIALEDKLKHAGQNQEFAHLDNLYTLCCHMIRRYGFYIDKEKLQEIKAITQKYYSTKEAAWNEASNLTVTASSPAIVNWLSERGCVANDAQQGTLKALTNTVPELKILLDAKVALKRIQYLDGLEKNTTYRKDGCATPGIIVSARQGLGRTSEGDLVRGMNIGGNLQNMGKEMREYPELPDYRPVFAAPKGYKLISLDLSGAHLRLAMKFANCASVAYLADGEDSHSYNASFIAQASETEYPELLGDYDKLKVIRKLNFEDLVCPDWLPKEQALKVYKKAKQYRDIAKTAIYTAINFGGPARLQEALKKVGIMLSLEECKTIMNSLWNAVPEIRDYVMHAKYIANKQTVYRPAELKMQTVLEWEELDEEEQAEARKKPVGYGILYTATGFMRYIPKHIQVAKDGRSYTSCSVSDVSATLWQNPEAKIIKRSQVRFLTEYIVPRSYQTITSTGYPSVWICNQAHDEILVTAREDLALDAATHLMRIMKEEWEAVCPGILGLEGTPEEAIGANWGATK